MCVTGFFNSFLLRYLIVTDRGRHSTFFMFECIVPIYFAGSLHEFQTVSLIPQGVFKSVCLVLAL